MQLLVLILWWCILAISVNCSQVEDVEKPLLSYSINSEENSAEFELDEIPSTTPPPWENNATTPAATTTSSPTCKTCLADEERRRHLDYIKAVLLEKLNMTHATHLNVSMSYPSTLKHIHPNRYDVQGDNPEVENEEIVFHTKKITSLAIKRPDSDDCCYFEFSPQIRQHKVISAMLWIYVQPGKIRQYTTDNLDLNIFAMRPSGERGERPVGSNKIPTRIKTGHWIRFNIKTTVQRWFGNPSTNLGIEVDFPRNGDTALVVTGPLNNRNTERPHLEIRVFPGDHTRTPIVQDCPVPNDVSYCCRHRLTVNFREPGYGWIIAPPSYDAYYCSGDCNGAHMIETTHAHLMTNAKVKLCCNPSMLESISMIYFEDVNTIVHRVIPGMVVARCECS